MATIYQIPVQFTMTGVVEISASSEEEAIAYFEENMDDIPLPTDGGEYLDDSYQRIEGDEITSYEIDSDTIANGLYDW